MPEILLACAVCQRETVGCSYCGACRHEKHTEECRQKWRDLILSYKAT